MSTSQLGLSRIGHRDGQRGFADRAAPIPQVFNGVVFGDVTIPGSAVAGETIDINGVVGFDCPLCITDRGIRVVAEVSHQEDEFIDNVGTLSGRGETAQFSFSIPAPASAGETVTVRLKGQRNPPVGGWETDNTIGPQDVNIVSQGEKTTENVLGVAPWVIGGGAIGGAAAQVTDAPLAAGVVGGAGVGLGANLVSQELRGFQFPTNQLLLTVAVLGGGALLVSRIDAPDLGGSLRRARRRAEAAIS